MKGIVLLLLLFNTSSFSQGYVFNKVVKDSVRARLKSYYINVDSKNNHSFMKETDTSITVCYRGPVYIKPFDLVTHFDINNICDRETYVYNCEKCLKKEVKARVKYLNWVELNDSTYVSSFKNKMRLKVNKPEGEQHSYCFEKFSYTKEEYDFLLPKKK